MKRTRPLYFEEDFFEELPLDDLRAEDFAEDFFAPLFELERELDFFAPAFEAPDRDDPDFEALFDELFLLVAGDLAIADVLSFPSKKGTGIASPAVGKKPPSDASRLTTQKSSLSLSTDIFDSLTLKLLFTRGERCPIVDIARDGESR